jgi:hypothetical protein
VDVVVGPVVVLAVDGVTVVVDVDVNVDDVVSSLGGHTSPCEVVLPLNVAGIT